MPEQRLTSKSTKSIVKQTEEQNSSTAILKQP